MSILLLCVFILALLSGIAWCCGTSTEGLYAGSWFPDLGGPFFEAARQLRWLAVLLIALAAALAMSGCSLHYQQTPAGDKQMIVGILVKTATGRMAGPAGEIENVVTDGEKAVDAIATTALGISTIENVTKAEIAKSSHATKQAISTNKTNAAIKGIEAKSATEQAAISAGVP